MLFSLFFVGQLSDPTPEREQQMLKDSVEQAVFAERMGFDRIWAVEHHGLEGYSHMSASEIFLTWVAARTERIRIGHGVVTMPFAYQHPVRVAERAAMLDVLSGGRLDVGAGNGASDQEMSLYGVDRENARAQVREALDILTGIWRSDHRFEWHGSLDIGPGAVLPRPVQRPHPPLFLACSREEAMRTAAKLGIGALVLGFGGPEMTRLRRAAYDAACAARTPEDLLSSTVNDHFAVVCPTIVLDDAEQARTIGLRGQQFFVESSRHWYGGGRPPEQDPAADGRAALERTRQEGPRRTARPRGPVQVRVRGGLQHRPPLRHRRRGGEARRGTGRRGGGRGDLPGADGDRAAPRVHGDHPAVGGEGHSALPLRTVTAAGLGTRTGAPGARR
nr:LLM class flavin-dependent oxidoreductase [Streptomyces sudanensis]